MNNYTIIMIDDSMVGKTSLSTKYISNTFSSEYNETIEDLYRKKITIDGTKITLDIIDISGKQNDFDLWSNIMTGYMFVYDVTNKSSFDKIVSIYRKKFKNIVKLPIILVGNKRDMNNIVVTTVMGMELAEEIGCPFFETSAKNNTVDTYFIACAKLIKNSGNINNIRKSILVNSDCCIIN